MEKLTLVSIFITLVPELGHSIEISHRPKFTILPFPLFMEHPNYFHSLNISLFEINFHSSNMSSF